MHAEHHIRRDDGRTDVERRAGRRRDPVFFDLQKLEQPVEDDFFVDERDAHALRRTVHTLEVLFGTENAHFALFVFECFQPFENALCIVEHGCREVECDGAVRLDDGLAPLAVFVLHRQHIIGEDLAESEFALIGGFFFQFFRFNEFHIRTSFMIRALRPFDFRTIIAHRSPFVNNLQNR